MVSALRLVLFLSIPFTLAAAELPVPTRLTVGATLETLQIGTTVYQRVQIRSINARTAMISHSGGMASIKLSDLPPDLQVAFGYNAQNAAAADAALTQAQVSAASNAAKEASPKKNPRARGQVSSTFDRLLQSFGQPPEIRASVDMRPKFVDLALGVKNQGARPSCAVFAIVSALEYQNAQINNQADRFSEEYLIWATRKTLNRAPRHPVVMSDAAADDSENLDSIDEGFALSEVVTALRAYGIPLQSSLPYTFVRTMDVADPPPQIVEEARNHRRVSVFALPGRDQATRMNNLIQALDAGVPVAVGMLWPSWRTLRSGFLNAQRPGDGGGHAVTIVGYENKTGKLEDTVFIFKNSWGSRWGTGGYGFATYGYLMINLMETALLDVEGSSGR